MRGADRRPPGSRLRCSNKQVHTGRPRYRYRVVQVDFTPKFEALVCMLFVRFLPLSTYSNAMPSLKLWLIQYVHLFVGQNRGSIKRASMYCTRGTNIPCMQQCLTSAIILAFQCPRLSNVCTSYAPPLSSPPSPSSTLPLWPILRLRLSVLKILYLLCVSMFIKKLLALNLCSHILTWILTLRSLF